MSIRVARSIEPMEDRSEPHDVKRPVWQGPAQHDVTRGSLAGEFADLGRALIAAAERAQRLEDLPEPVDHVTGEAVSIEPESRSLWKREHLLELEKFMVTIRDTNERLDTVTRVLAEYSLREGISQRRVASALGLSTNTINRWAREPIADQIYQ